MFYIKFLHASRRSMRITRRDGRVRTLNGTLLMTTRLSILHRRAARQLTGRLVLSAMTAIVLAGCSGHMQGTIRDEGTPVQFSYKPGAFAHVFIAEIDGERFSGRAPPVGTKSYRFPVSGSVYTAVGNVYAIMRGDRGSTLRCVMRYADSTGSTTSGVLGECFHSDGRIIDVVA